MAVEPIPIPMMDNPVSDTGRFSRPWTQYIDKLNTAVATAAAGMGVTDGTDAAAGQVGEYLTASGGPVTLTTNATANVATLNLTAGDWDVSGLVSFSAGAGTHTSFGAGLDTIGILNQSTFPAGALTQGIGIPPKRYNASVATVVHLVAVATFSAGTVTAQGVVSARRAR